VKPIFQFALGLPAAPQARRPLLFDGKQITEVGAAAIDAQFAVPSVGYLLVLSWDAPDEETPWLLLLDESFHPLDRHEFGGFFAAGATSRVIPEAEDRVRLRVGNKDYVADIQRGRWWRRARYRLSVRAANIDRTVVRWTAMAAGWEGSATDSPRSPLGLGPGIGG
jgi:hypothetical protein